MLLFRTVSVPSVTAVLALVADAADPLALLSTLLAELLLGGMVRRKELLLWVVVWLGGGYGCRRLRHIATLTENPKQGARSGGRKRRHR